MYLQIKVNEWVRDCFGADAKDLEPRIRALRFFEEAIELVQAVGLTYDDCEELAVSVYNKPLGSIPQEVGGTMTTLAALSTSLGVNMETAMAMELSRMHENIDEIRRKTKLKKR